MEVVNKVLTEEDALEYLNKVKEAFPNNEKVYKTFLKLLVEFKNKRIDKEGVKEKVEEMFKGHPNLILGFSIFATYSHPWRKNEQPAAKSLFGGYEDASKFVDKIKSRFQDNRNVYKSFLNIMNMVGEGQKSVTQAYLEVASLFEGHTDLLHELILFLPDASGAASR